MSAFPEQFQSDLSKRGICGSWNHLDFVNQDFQAFENHHPPHHELGYQPLTSLQGSMILVLDHLKIMRSRKINLKPYFNE
jgi:hypothetical protein